MPEQPKLKRAIGFPLLVLYALGVTIGAGIYVLIGTTAARAGIYAPVAFLVAAFVMAFNAGSFAEFSTRIPVSAGEAAYVDAGFGLKWLTLAAGSSIIFSATIAAAAISLGSAGYVGALIDLPQPVIVTILIVLMGLIAAWGVKESVVFAALLTVIELIGLLVIIVAGYWYNPTIFSDLGDIVPALDDKIALSGIFAASLIAFFAFIGFDDVVNLVEETKNPARNMPLAILITLVIATILYFAVTAIAVLSVPLDDLAGSSAPIGLLFERLTGVSPLAITLIAVVATLNGIVIQIVMAARVLYGLGNEGSIPAFFAIINQKTRTPLISTVIITAVILLLALFFPMTQLAMTTTKLILFVFSLVNLSLIAIKLRHQPSPKGIFTVRIWVPVCGFIGCLTLLVGPYIVG